VAGLIIIGLMFPIEFGKTFLSPLGLNPPVGSELPLVDCFLGGRILVVAGEDVPRPPGGAYEGPPGF
jgi:hypothetical protein